MYHQPLPSATFLLYAVRVSVQLLLDFVRVVPVSPKFGLRQDLHPNTVARFVHRSIGFPVSPELLPLLLSASPSPCRLVEMLQVLPQPLCVLSYRLFWHVSQEAVHQVNL
ncbi:hypothetical protein T05_6789 [Trichinella murrelli]|uniref:Secreted protein n=1 Tax=Trichinella murrelli TaxID=144512 RepID=A0A0V0TVA2_9BILA|nr:hypothetical protein T05_6789 [Trichinella murrelli]